MSTATTVQSGYTAAPPLADVLPPVKQRGRVMTFVRRNPAITLGGTLLLMMIRHGELSRVAALIYLVPPLTVLEAYILFGESLDAVQIAGVAVTVMGVWLATRR